MHINMTFEFQLKKNKLFVNGFRRCIEDYIEIASNYSAILYFFF